jgi:hypothetical protein
VRPNWNDRGTLALIGSALTLALLARQFPLRRRPRPKVLNATTDITWDTVAKWLRSGERAVEPDEIDFFGHRDVARRVAAAVREGRSVSVLGPYGSGKTGILNAVKAELWTRPGELFVVAELNAWAISESQDAPRLGLERIISALDDHVDMQKFRGLPSAYRRLADAEPTGWIAKLIGQAQEGDPVEQIGRLAPVLDALQARVILFLEDVERAEEAGFDTRHLQRFLWAIRGTDRVSYVLAYAP